MQPAILRPTPLTFHPITRDGPLLPAWLELYESAFPRSERLPAEALLQMLATGEPPGVQMLAVLDERGELAGLAIFERREDPGVLFLWYLAVTPGLRSRGLGSVIYAQIAQACAAGCQALVFDVEIPELAADEAERSLRARRIAFYRRQGARLLTGIHYTFQSGPEDPRVALHIMVHPLRRLDAGAAFELAQRVVGAQDLRQTGPLALI